jgi:DNA-binding beta-propeller fold protein YncE
MRKGIFIAIVLAGVLGFMLMGVSVPGAQELRVISEETVTGFVHPESVAYDPDEKVLYVGQFGSVLKPALKDGKGTISTVSLKGKILEEQCLPAPGGILNKPKGIWVEGTRLWVTDIDVVWIFDLKTRKGREVKLPGAIFANDPTVIGNALFVSDYKKDLIYRVEPADCLEMPGNPKVSAFPGPLPFAPNGLFPAFDGSLLAVGFDKSAQEGRIHSITMEGTITVLATGLGSLDGVAQLEDGSILVTDWKVGSLLWWNTTDGVKRLATGFKGPADFCVVPEAQGLMVAVPDLVKSEVRMIRLAR